MAIPPALKLRSFGPCPISAAASGAPTNEIATISRTTASETTAARFEAKRAATSLQYPSGLAAASATRASDEPDAWIERGARDVGEQVQDDHRGRGDQDDARDGRQVEARVLH